MVQYLTFVSLSCSAMSRYKSFIELHLKLTISRANSIICYHFISTDYILLRMIKKKHKNLTKTFQNIEKTTTKSNNSLQITSQINKNV